MTETRAIIDDRCNRMGIRFQDAAKRIGVSDTTLRKKCKAPVLFTGIELNNMSGFLTPDQMDVVYAEIRSWK